MSFALFGRDAYYFIVVVRVSISFYKSFMNENVLVVVVVNAKIRGKTFENMNEIENSE